jgi:uncharacterized membrane protein
MLDKSIRKLLTSPPILLAAVIADKVPAETVFPSTCSPNINIDAERLREENRKVFRQMIPDVTRNYKAKSYTLIF